ncbi:MAG: hypothetical protein ACKV2Q_18985 [Planctomycetaceae bacterium]
MMLRRMILAAVLTLGVGVIDPLAQTAQACPMCKVATEQDTMLPTAYMYSILFMMGMMFTIGGGIGFGMYLLGRKENAAIEGWEQDPPDAEPNSEAPLPGGLQPAAT